MYFSVIELNRTAARVGDIVRLSGGDGYQVHSRIWSLFSDGPGRRRDFIYRQGTMNEWPRFYAVSARPPSDSSGLWSIASKIYEPRLSRGQRLVFSLRANPVHSKRDVQNRQHRHDVVMEARKRHAGSGGKLRILLSEIIQQEGAGWLSAKSEKLGFAIEPGAIRVDGYQQHVLYKINGKITFSTLDFNGTLTVKNPEAFIQALYYGIGPAKGFGCGLMMVKKA